MISRMRPSFWRKAPGHLAEDGAVEEARFAIVLGGAFEGGDVKVGDGVAGVASVANFPGVVG